MKRIAVVLSVLFIILGCKRRLEFVPAAEPNYPNRLMYNATDERYSGAMGLERYQTGYDAFFPDEVEVPITTFEKAFSFAYDVFVKKYGKEWIEHQLPLQIDYQDGIWIVQGAFPRSKFPKSVYVGGIAHIAFREDTGEVLYVFHSQ